MTSSWIIWRSSKSSEKCPYAREAGRFETDRRKKKAETRVKCHKPRNETATQSWKKQRRSFLEPLGRVNPCQSPNFRLVISRTVRGKNSVDLSHQICDILLSQPRNLPLINDRIYLGAFRWSALHRPPSG